MHLFYEMLTNLLRLVITNYTHQANVLSQIEMFLCCLCTSVHSFNTSNQYSNQTNSGLCSSQVELVEG